LSFSCLKWLYTTGGGSADDAENWETVFEYEGANSDRELTIRDIDIEVE
jgi:hypothetical protein